MPMVPFANACFTITRSWPPWTRAAFLLPDIASDRKSQKICRTVLLFKLQRLCSFCNRLDKSALLLARIRKPFIVEVFIHTCEGSSRGSRSYQAERPAKAIPSSYKHEICCCQSAD